MQGKRRGKDERERSRKEKNRSEKRVVATKPKNSGAEKNRG
jgi:hypothetical protein